MNAMIVDSSALTEQVVIDGCWPAFDSAGQRCPPCACFARRKRSPRSHLTMLRGAMSGVPDGQSGRA
ncbi:hypothetical protein LNP74_24850 [Klebsiella pneumoniae subsp. pneumoniae]|nr:hypothetical protein [Klebsiella pneumoniae subsp. pneumoniae]